MSGEHLGASGARRWIQARGESGEHDVGEKTWNSSLPTASAAREPGEAAACTPSVAYGVGATRRSSGAYPSAGWRLALGRLGRRGPRRLRLAPRATINAYYSAARTNLASRCMLLIVPPTVKQLSSIAVAGQYLRARACARRRGHVHAHVARQGDERTSPQATRTCTKHRLVRHRACPRPGSICGSKRPMLRRRCGSRGRRRRSLASRRLYSRP